MLSPDAASPFPTPMECFDESEIPGNICTRLGRGLPTTNMQSTRKAVLTLDNRYHQTDTIGFTSSICFRFYNYLPLDTSRDAVFSQVKKCVEPKVFSPREFHSNRVEYSLHQAI